MLKICLTPFAILLLSLTVSAQNGTPQNSEINRELSISAKPRAIYTKQASKKNVEGTVRLRVTFLATGEIGEVLYVSETSRKKKLTKNGLVQQSIEAAKKMKFEPARVNGQPVTVTKLVEYTFTLY